MSRPCSWTSPWAVGDDGKINLDRVCYLVSRDWGLYHTVQINLGRVRDIGRRDRSNLRGGRADRSPGRSATCTPWNGSQRA